MKHVVIAGGGFAGARIARKLRKEKDIKVTLINNSEDFRYSPALYRAATGIKLGAARIPLEWMLLDSGNADLVIGTVTRLDKANKAIYLEDGTRIDYDYVIFALGAVTSYFNIEGLSQYSYGIKTAEEVKKLKQHIHDKVVDNSSEGHNYVIIGAGPTGVELAGALGSYLKHVYKRHQHKQRNVQIYLIEAGPRILPQMSEKASRVVYERLQRLRVKILTEVRVESETVRSLHTSLGAIKTHDVIWTAGTSNNPFFAQYPEIFPVDKRGRVLVDKHLQVSSEIYVCGDNAATKHAGLAYTAVGHANYVAKDIKTRVRHMSKRPVEKDRLPLQMVPAGGKWSVFQYRKLVLHGKYVGMFRGIADYIGYSDVLGLIKAWTIWSNRNKTEESCSRCRI